VADVLELAPFHLARLQRQAWRGAFQRLDAGHLVRADGALPSCHARGGLAIGGTHIGDLVITLFWRLVGGGCQPVPNQVRFEIGFFEQPPGVPRRDRLDNTAPDDLVRQLTVAPLTDRSTAVSRLLTRQGDDLADLLGGELRRRARFGCIRQPFGHTNFLQRHTCKLQPASSPMARRLVVTFSSRAICKLLHPSPASSTMCARNANCWPVVYARTKRSRSARSRSLSTTFGGLGVAIVHSGQIKLPDLTRRPDQPRGPKSRLHSANVYSASAAEN